MDDEALPNATSGTVKDAYLMGLRAPVNTDKSLIRCRVILGIVLWVFLVRWRYGSPLLCCGHPWHTISPVLALVAQLPIRR